MTDTERNAPPRPTWEVDARFDGGWPALTEALKLRDCPLKPWLTERFPSTNTKPVFQQYKDTVGPLVVPASEAATGGGTGTVGGAYDYLVRFLVSPEPGMDLPVLGAQRVGGRMPMALAELATLLGTQATSPSELEALGGVVVIDGPQPPTTLDTELLARGCWALALLTELGRGVPPQRSPLADLNRQTVSGDALLGLASVPALEQLAELREQAEAVLLPALASRAGSWAIGPVFEGSKLMNADADLIAAGTLVEIKTVLGSKRKDGSRYASLDSQTLFQLLGYVLLDFQDDFAIHELALFSARYGHLSAWNLQDLLDTLAGRPIDLPALRDEFEQFLRNHAGARPQPL